MVKSTLSVANHKTTQPQQTITDTIHRQHTLYVAHGHHTLYVDNDGLLWFCGCMVSYRESTFYSACQITVETYQFLLLSCMERRFYM